MNIGDRIRELRILNKMSQEELGSRVGVHRAAIQKYESGVVKNIPLSTIETFANIFDVSPSYLAGWNENSNETSKELYAHKIFKHLYDIDTSEILYLISKLNKKGRSRALEYLTEMQKLYSNADS